MLRILVTLLSVLGTVWQTAHADVDSKFKSNPFERFAIQTADGYFKQAYHWQFNVGEGKPKLVVFLNHGSGGEWADNIGERLGKCGGDYTVLSPTKDYQGSPYSGLCVIDASGTRTHLADYRTHHVPVSAKLHDFMLRRHVGSARFAAWVWQNAFTSQGYEVHVFSVGRYNIAQRPEDFNNELYWLNVTDPASVTRDTLPPYNFEGYGVDDIPNDNRPFHAAPDVSAFDNMFLYRAVKLRYPALDMSRLVVEGRSNGGSAMIALASDHAIWPQHFRSLWSRNLPSQSFSPSSFRSELTQLLGGDFYANVLFVSSWYGGCRLDGYMERDPQLPPGVVAVDGDTREGYRVALRTLFHFGAQDDIYTEACDERVAESRANSANTPRFSANSYGVDGQFPVYGWVHNPADHGFDYQDVYKNLPKYSASSQLKAARARAAIETTINTARIEVGLAGGYQLPYDLD